IGWLISNCRVFREKNCAGSGPIILPGARQYSGLQDRKRKRLENGRRTRLCSLVGMPIPIIVRAKRRGVRGLSASAFCTRSHWKDRQMIFRNSALTVAALVAFGGGAPAQERVVNIYNWSDYIDESILEDF